ncbi:hypothetical protein JHK85_044307 [Glycine max]|nr:hypothetical protein JHK86_043642 [Glycine max]KAG4957927.1 hypothetical protein JHK85_044307 [Glycine max]
MYICWNDILSMGDAGFMLEFVKFLNAKSFEVREMAAEALSGMVIVPRNRKSGRKKIVSSGYAKNIEKLADAEVSSDANRLVKKSVLDIGPRKYEGSDNMHNISSTMDKGYDHGEAARETSKWPGVDGRYDSREKTRV